MARVFDVVNEVDETIPPPRRWKTKKKMENPLEKREKLPDFTEKYEENLKRKLFEEDLKKMASKNMNNEDNEESAYYETDRKLVHHKRDGE